jgi:hypothetical protein
MSLVKFYSRLSKLLLRGQIDEQDVSMCLKQLQGHLPVLVQCQEAENVRELLQNHLEALNALDRKKIFHAHLMAAAMNAWKLLNDPQRALLHLQQLFPFLKGFNSKKGSAASLMQIYQCDHERPARYLVAGRNCSISLPLPGVLMIQSNCSPNSSRNSITSVKRFSDSPKFSQRQP